MSEVIKPVEFWIKENERLRTAIDEANRIVRMSAKVNLAFIEEFVFTKQPTRIIK